MLTKYAYRHIKRIALGVPENKVCEFVGRFECNLN